MKEHSTIVFGTPITVWASCDRLFPLTDSPSIATIWSADVLKLQRHSLAQLLLHMQISPSAGILNDNLPPTDTSLHRSRGPLLSIRFTSNASGSSSDFLKYAPIPTRVLEAHRDEHVERPLLCAPRTYELATERWSFSIDVLFIQDSSSAGETHARALSQLRANINLKNRLEETYLWRTS